MNVKEELTPQDSEIPELSEELKRILDERLEEDERTYMPAKEFLEQLRKKYGF